MLISFVISSQGKIEELKKTLNSLENQECKNFEIILVSDDSNLNKDFYNFLCDKFFNDKKMTIIFNSRDQSVSANWNLAIDLVAGSYISFLQEGDFLESCFVKQIKTTIEKCNNKLEVIEYSQKLFGEIVEPDSNLSRNFLDFDRIYNLPNDKDVYAYIEQNIYNKIFLVKLIKKFRIRFRYFNHYDCLFLYQVLGHARTFYKIENVLSINYSNIFKYSVFDLVNQYPHILNYYRKIGNYKNLKDQLNYVYVRQLAYKFLLLVSKFDNNHLYRKALKFSSTKMKGKIGINFINNSVYKENKEHEFTEFIRNYHNFINSELRRIR